MVVTLSHSGYIKRQPVSEYRTQRKGGKGKQAATTKEDDWIEQLFIANTHETLLGFSDKGRVYWKKVWEVPQGSRTAEEDRLSTIGLYCQMRKLLRYFLSKLSMKTTTFFGYK